MQSLFITYQRPIPSRLCIICSCSCLIRTHKWKNWICTKHNHFRNLELCEIIQIHPWWNCWNCLSGCFWIRSWSSWPFRRFRGTWTTCCTGCVKGWLGWKRGKAFHEKGTCMNWQRISKISKVSPSCLKYFLSDFLQLLEEMFGNQTWYWQILTVHSVLLPLQNLNLGPNKTP